MYISPYIQQLNYRRTHIPTGSSSSSNHDNINNNNNYNNNNNNNDFNNKNLSKLVLLSGFEMENYIHV